MSDLVGNPEDRFSRVAAHLIELIFKSFTVRISLDISTIYNPQLIVSSLE